MAVQTGRLPMRCRGCRVGAYACFLLKVTSPLCRMTQHKRTQDDNFFKGWNDFWMDSNLDCDVCACFVWCLHLWISMILLLLFGCPGSVLYISLQLCVVRHVMQLPGFSQPHAKFTHGFRLMLCGAYDVSCCKIVLGETFCPGTWGEFVCVYMDALSVSFFRSLNSLKI